MKTVKLMRIDIRNFKGIESYVFEPKGKSVTISGRNGIGKTTIYDAYLWCLFGCTCKKNEVVQPLDNDNKIKQGLQTTVEVHLEIDGIVTTLRRSVNTEISRFCNDVPLAAKKYDAKVDSIFTRDKWAMLSNINNFMGLPIDTRRNMLLELCDKDGVKMPESIAKELAKGKTLDELEEQVKKSKKQADKEIDAIPIAIQSQSRLLVTDDFDALQQKEQELRREIDDIDTILQASSKDMQFVIELRKKIDDLETQKTTFTKKWWDGYNEELQRLQGELAKEKENLNDEENALRKAVDAHIANQDKLSTLTDEFDRLKNEWHSINNEQPQQSTLLVCPTCGRSFSKEEREVYESKLMDAYYKQKSERLQKVVDDATLTKEKMVVLKGLINEFEQVKKALYQRQVNAAKERVNEIQAQIEQVKKEDINDSAELVRISKQLEDAQEKLKASNNQSKEGYEQRKNELKEQLADVAKRLSAKEMNVRITQENERLKAREKELAQMIAYFDAITHDIKRYRREVIKYTENAINAQFKQVKWKFAERNITNDEEKKICDCLIDGVPYSNLNTAARINAGIDIVLGLSKGYDVALPLFVDNRESVLDICVDTSNSQVIYLQVTNDPNLSITF